MTTSANKPILNQPTRNPQLAPDTETRSDTSPRGHLTNFPENVLTVRPWQDPVLDQLGHDARSLYVERYWLPILGPSATLLVRRLSMSLEDSPEGFDLACAPWALELGIGMRGGKNGPFWRALDRCCRFGTAQRTSTLLMVRTKLPPLTMHQVMRLPEHVQASHHAWTAKQMGVVSTRPTRPQISTRAADSPPSAA